MESKQTATTEQNLLYKHSQVSQRINPLLEDRNETLANWRADIHSTKTETLEED